MKEQHAFPLAWTDAMKLVESVNSPLAGALRLFTKPGSKAAYKATYRYGDAVIDSDGKLRPPCSANACQACGDLQESCRNEIPRCRQA